MKAQLGRLRIQSMSPSSRALLAIAFFAVESSAFLPSVAQRSLSPVQRQAVPEAQLEQFAVGRRAALGGLGLGLAAVVSQPRLALALSADDFSNQMLSYGVKDYAPCPDGYSPVIEFYGRALQGVDPLLVTFHTPSGWLLVRPNINKNGEDGTVSTGDYGKGDSCSFFYGAPLAGRNLGDRATLEDIVYAGLTVKGAAQVQGFKLKKFKKLEAATDSPYYLVEYEYTLLTGAGFEINRRGVGSVCAVGDKSTQAMLGASTDIRYKKVEDRLREVASSFRVHDGIKPPLAE